MFSGIVQKKEKIVSVTNQEGLSQFVIQLDELAQGLTIGASVAISGVCLTVVSQTEDTATFEVMSETLAKTTLGLLEMGSEVNIERSVRVGDEIGGHRVSGHVIGKGMTTNVETPPSNWIIKIQCDPVWMDDILSKGFVAVDGCSLTVVDTGSDWFTIHLIPETLRVTTFGSKGVGDAVNIELDPETQAIVTTVKRYLSTHPLV